MDRRLISCSYSNGISSYLFYGEEELCHTLSLSFSIQSRAFNAFSRIRNRAIIEVRGTFKKFFSDLLLQGVEI